LNFDTPNTSLVGEINKDKKLFTNSLPYNLDDEAIIGARMDYTTNTISVAENYKVLFPNILGFEPYVTLEARE